MHWRLGLQHLCGGCDSTHNSVYSSDTITCHSPSCSDHTGLPTVPTTGQCHLLWNIVLSVLRAEKALLSITISFRSQIRTRDFGPDHPIWDLPLHPSTISLFISAEPYHYLKSSYSFMCLLASPISSGNSKSTEILPAFLMMYLQLLKQYLLHGRDSIKIMIL